MEERSIDAAGTYTTSVLFGIVPSTSGDLILDLVLSEPVATADITVNTAGVTVLAEITDLVGHLVRLKLTGVTAGTESEGEFEVTYKLNPR